MIKYCMWVSVFSYSFLLGGDTGCGYSVSWCFSIFFAFLPITNILSML